MARRLAIGSVQLSDRAPRIVAAGGEAELEALAAAGGADLVELRADLCEEPRPETLPSLLARLRAGGRPLILTTRAAAEGGRPMDEARRRAPYTRGLPHTDAIDLEIAPTALAAPPPRPVGPPPLSGAARPAPPPPPSTIAAERRSLRRSWRGRGAAVGAPLRRHARGAVVPRRAGEAKRRRRPRAPALLHLR